MPARATAPMNNQRQSHPRRPFHPGPTPKSGARRRRERLSRGEGFPGQGGVAGATRDRPLSAEVPGDCSPKAHRQGGCWKKTAGTLCLPKITRSRLPVGRRPLCWVARRTAGSSGSGPTAHSFAIFCVRIEPCTFGPLRNPSVGESSNGIGSFRARANSSHSGSSMDNTPGFAHVLDRRSWRVWTASGCST